MKLLFGLIGLSLMAAPVIKTKEPEMIENTPISKIFHVSDKDIIAVSTRIRYSTLIILPPGENILDFICGDGTNGVSVDGGPKGNWVINGVQNMAYVKPTQEGSQTNLNLITESGRVYSFTLREVGPKGQPDLKLFVENKDAGLLASLKPRFVAREQVSDYQEQVKIAQAETARVRDEAQKEIEAVKKQQQTTIAMAKAGMPQTIKHPYTYTNKKAFGVDAIYTDGKFTYISAHPQEAFAVYEIRDGEPSVIQFQLSENLYTIPKLLDRGYLRIGKENMHFSRKDQ
jgi:type IV secretory pathway VirB9-like protein